MVDAEQTRYAKNRKTLPYAVQALECKDFIHYTEESKTQRGGRSILLWKRLAWMDYRLRHEVIGRLEDRLNGLLRKILRYKTPKELFYRELDYIYTQQRFRQQIFKLQRNSSIYYYNLGKKIMFLLKKVISNALITVC